MLLQPPGGAARPALATHGVQLVDEEHAAAVRGRAAARLVEQRAHALGAATDEDLDEVGSGASEEGKAGGGGDRLGEEGLARAWLGGG